MHTENRLLFFSFFFLNTLSDPTGIMRGGGRYDKSREDKCLLSLRFVPTTPSSAQCQEAEENDTFRPTLIEFRHGTALYGAVPFVICTS